ncbi:unnamed protein product [Heterosigma akashiwo]
MPHHKACNIVDNLHPQPNKIEMSCSSKTELCPTPCNQRNSFLLRRQLRGGAFFTFTTRFSSTELGALIWPINAARLIAVDWWSCFVSTNFRTFAVASRK